jgi:hypothetical protein
VNAHFERAFTQIFQNRPVENLVSFELEWKNGTFEKIEGRTISEAWQRAGFGKQHIQQLKGYRAL